MDLTPPHQFPCDPTSRFFPKEWKDVYFRRYTDFHHTLYYVCPICNDQFDADQKDVLEGDHIWPWSLLGSSTWGNYQLICSNCNKAKSNKINNEIRTALCDSGFQNVISRYIQEAHPDLLHLLQRAYEFG